MNYMRKLGIALTIVASIALTAFIPNADAATIQYQVKSGDSYWKIAIKYGVTVNDLFAANNATSTLIYPGQTVLIPEKDTGITAAEKDLMARLVHAEAKGEPYEGKVAVAKVILNRVDSPEFPNTISGVINEKVGQSYAFTPVKNGAINEPADAEAKKAVEEAIATRENGKEALYFYNPKISTSDWIFTREVIATIGNHRFAK